MLPILTCISEGLFLSEIKVYEIKITSEFKEFVTRRELLNEHMIFQISSQTQIINYKFLSM